MTNEDNCIDKVCTFNRFHTLLVGALNEGLTDSDFSLIQIKLMFELANSTNVATADLIKVLAIDKDYLSSIVTSLFKQGLIDKTPDSENNKRIVLTLSTKGQEIFAKLNQASINEVQKLIAPLSDLEKDELTVAMAKIRQLLGPQPSQRKYILRDPKPGDLSWIAHRNGKLYWDEYQWDLSFEALVCNIIAEYIENYDESCERCWVAEMDGKIVGSVFLVRHDQTTAQLRVLYVEAHARGLGLGRKLVEECINHAKSTGYKRILLLTKSALTSARRIYQSAGFKLIDEEHHHCYGQDLVGQTYALDLTE